MTNLKADRRGERGGGGGVAGGGGEWCVVVSSLTVWQTCVIGLLLFALAFGPLATLLSLFGLCSSALQKKIYYFNSAGEIYLICGNYWSVLLLLPRWKVVVIVNCRRCRRYKLSSLLSRWELYAKLENSTHLLFLRFILFNSNISVLHKRRRCKNFATA